MAIAFIVIGAILLAAVIGFWCVKGQPFDWDSFSRSTRVGPHFSVMNNPGQPLKKKNGS